MGNPVTQEGKTFIPVVSVSVGCAAGNATQLIDKIPEMVKGMNQQ